MNKQLGLLLSACFLCAQLLSLSHMSDYAFEKHSHEDQLCGVYIQSKFADGDIVSNHPLASAFISVSSVLLVTPHRDYAFTTLTTTLPRAPPFNV
ncbi:hypothetical protein [Agarilytica rhodophyticola]|uniref:hypothetical protein n=1 Tax=Agarilytica rhodophyticola TaxID=1737490 RepID=UPI000B345135|nr:hypothetical protein [Agarilytica rhodophyticola]